MFVVLTTVGSQSAASALGRSLVQKGLAACVQLEPINSIYFWEGKLEEDTETRLVIKTTRLDELKKYIHSPGVHPYKVPQWVVLEAKDVSEAYLGWAKETQNREIKEEM